MKRSKVEIILDEIGIPLTMNGYNYIIEAMQIVRKGNYDTIMDIYTKIARKYKTNPSNIERCIRNVQNIYQNEFKKYFKIKYKISNSRLFALMLRKVEV